MSKINVNFTLRGEYFRQSLEDESLVHGLTVPKASIKKYNVTAFWVILLYIFREYSSLI